MFPGQKPGKPLSNMAMLALLRRVGRGDLTTHGFRSTFRDWCAEATNYPREVAEAALAHTLGDKVEAAYRRGDLMEKRRRLMADWAEYCGRATPAGKWSCSMLRGRDAADRTNTVPHPPICQPGSRGHILARGPLYPKL